MKGFDIMANISFKDLYFLSTHGLSCRNIADMSGDSKTNITTLQHKWGIADIRTTKDPHFKPNYYFDKIDTPEKAYTLGFILADGNISLKNQVELKIQLQDKEVLDFISTILNSEVYTSNKVDKSKRIFPFARTVRTVKDILKFVGGRLKQERHYPRVRKDLERYLLLGFFDADGCLTWGIRKDRNRIWHKVSLSSSLSILEGAQQHLFKLGISTKLRPKKNENCYILEFSNKSDVLKFLEYIYPDDSFIILNRKYLKYKALRLELEEFGGTTIK